MPPPENPRREDPPPLGDRPGEIAAHHIEAATAPARWLLEAGADGGVALTATYALARAVVREAAERWPGWWDAELFGPPHREARRGGWRDPDGQAPTELDISWVVSEVLCRGEAYGVIDRRPETGESRFHRRQIVLTDAARVALGLDGERSPGMSVLVFDAELLNAPGVRARLAAGARQHLTALHDAIQEAFGWCDDHLYSFWIDGEFWGSENAEFARPGTPDRPAQTADVPLAELDLAIGAKIAYVFDYGDEWRVRLVLRQQTDADGGAYPRVINREGTPPPQYPEQHQD